MMEWARDTNRILEQLAADAAAANGEEPGIPGGRQPGVAPQVLPTDYDGTMSYHSKYGFVNNRPPVIFFFDSIFFFSCP